MNSSFEYIVIGGGITGLCIARELLIKNPKTRIAILEKEPTVGKHASGRNSGVVHSGIYYPNDSNKGRFCVRGSNLMREYAEKNNIPIRQNGKVIVAKASDDVPQLDVLIERGQQNGVRCERITLDQLKTIEPEAKSLDSAIFCPETASIDSIKLLSHILNFVSNHENVEVLYNSEALEIDAANKTLNLHGRTLAFEYLINCAGAYADEVAKNFGIHGEYRMLPFKGLYWEFLGNSKIQRHIYPVPNLRMPFLGVHLSPNIYGQTLIGPTALPAFGRENYEWLKGIEWTELPSNLFELATMWINNQQNFRNLVKEESARYLKSRLLKECQAMSPNVQMKNVGSLIKVGIRPQLVDIKQSRLVMDFMVKKTSSSLHVLNAISPAFTCGFAFAEHLVTNEI